MAASRRSGGAECSISCSEESQKIVSEAVRRRVSKVALGMVTLHSNGNPKTILSEIGPVINCGCSYK